MLRPFWRRPVPKVIEASFFGDRLVEGEGFEIHKSGLWFVATLRLGLLKAG
jgi:hypothetical protein